MPFSLIKGTFRPGTGVPAGDTVRFAPDVPDHLFRLRRSGRPPGIDPINGTTALRYEGIDAIEGAALLPFSADARANLEFLGRSDINRPDINRNLRGYVLARRLGPDGRPISFVFFRDTLEVDGERVFLGAGRMCDSVNFKLLQAGHVYPLYYDTLFDELREELCAAVREARAACRGLWPEDVTNSGVRWAGAGCLATLKPLFPKIWRRLAGYTKDDDFAMCSDRLDRFGAYLEARDDRVRVAGSDHFTGLERMLEIDGDTLRMKPRPEDLVFRA